MSLQHLTIGGREATVAFMTSLGGEVVEPAAASVAVARFADGSVAYYHVGEPRALGDKPGHEFHGNQYTGGTSSASDHVVEQRLSDLVAGGATVAKTKNAASAARDVESVLSEMEARGYRLPYSVAIEEGEEGQTSPEALWGESDDLIVTVPRATGDLDAASRAYFGGTTTVDGVETDRYVGTTLRDLIIHEMGHVQHGEVNEDPIPADRKAAAARVSEYATTSTGEFIAESFTRLYRGEKLHPDSQKFYDELGGPKVLSERRALGDVVGHPFHGNQWTQIDQAMAATPGSPGTKLSAELKRRLSDPTEEYARLRMEAETVGEALAFHGTTSQALAYIAQDGLEGGHGLGADEWARTHRPDSSRVFERGKALIGGRATSVFLTSYPAQAEEFADYAQQVVREKTGLLTTPVTLAVTIPREALDRLRLDEFSSGVRFEGKIPPAWIRRLDETGKKLPITRAAGEGGLTFYVTFLVLDDEEPRAAGDKPGHEFHGNQWTFGLPPTSDDPAPGSRYMYHSTAISSLASIAKSGLEPRHGLISLSPHLSSVYEWAGLIGRPDEQIALLRTPRAGLSLRQHDESDPGDAYDPHDPSAETGTYHPIRAERLEVYRGGKWEPLVGLRSAGDYTGHPFHGNQYTGSVADAIDSVADAIDPVVKNVPVDGPTLTRQEFADRVKATGFKAIEVSEVPKELVQALGARDEGALPVGAADGVEAALKDLDRDAPEIARAMREHVPLVLARYDPAASATTASGPTGTYLFVNTSPDALNGLNHESSADFTVGMRRAMTLPEGERLREAYRGVVFHEAGHVADRMSGGRLSVALCSDLIKPGVSEGELRKTLESISHYAVQGGPSEAAAEVFAASMLGIKLPVAKRTQELIEGINARGRRGKRA